MFCTNKIVQNNIYTNSCQPYNQLHIIFVNLKIWTSFFVIESEVVDSPITWTFCLHFADHGGSTHRKRNWYRRKYLQHCPTYQDNGSGELCLLYQKKYKRSYFTKFCFVLFCQRRRRKTLCFAYVKIKGQKKHKEEK